MKIIIILEKYGGFCNRLFQSLHYHAYAIDKQLIFLNPSIIGILKFDNYFFNVFDKIKNYILKLISKIISILNTKDDIHILFGKENYIRIVRGWNFRDYDLTCKHHEKLKNIYKFCDKNLTKNSLYLKNYLNKKKTSGKLLIGLHIRRGDYKLWNDGKYFFKDNFYKEVINKVKIEYKTKGQDPFIIAVSDEKIDPKLGFHYNVNGSWIEDQVALQNCDLLIGPPSTFTMWASYISEIPLATLTKDKIFNLDDFMICRG